MKVEVLQGNHEGSIMAENLSKARAQIAGHRKQIRGSIEKYGRYPEAYQKQNQLKTIENCQNQIKKLVDRYPTLRNEGSWEDAWKPGDRTY